MADYEDLTIDQGADVAIELHLVDPDGSKKNLTGYNASAYMKRSYGEDSDFVAFSTLISVPQTDGFVKNPFLFVFYSFCNTVTVQTKPAGGVWTNQEQV